MMKHSIISISMLILASQGRRILEEISLQDISAEVMEAEELDVGINEAEEVDVGIKEELNTELDS